MAVNGRSWGTRWYKKRPQLGPRKKKKGYQKATENEKKVTKKWPKKNVSGLPPFAYPLLQHVDPGSRQSQSAMDARWHILSLLWRMFGDKSLARFSLGKADRRFATKNLPHF